MVIVWKSMCSFYRIMITYSSERKFDLNTDGKHYIKVWSSKLLAILWLGNILYAIYVHFWLPKTKNEFLWSPIPEKYSLQWCSVGQTTTKVKLFHKCGKLNSERCCQVLTMGLDVFNPFELLATMQIRNWKLFVEKNSRKYENHWMTLQNNKVINWSYKFMANRLSRLSA